jgi:hypothetical protein
MGTEAVIVHDRNSEEIYHDYAAPQMYEGKLHKLYDDSAGNRIYRVPRRYPHLARIVDGARMRGFPVPATEPDFGLLSDYVDAVENGPSQSIAFHRVDHRTMRIRTRLEAGQLLLVQETFDPAWKARSGSRLAPTSKDLLGFLLIDPGPGDHDILLQFETPLENRLGAAAFVFGAATVVWLLVRGFTGSRS